MILNLLRTQEIRFLIVGAYNTLFSFLMNNALLFFVSDEYVIITLMLAYPIGLVHNLFTFEGLVFRSNVKMINGLIRLNNSYIFTVIIGISLTSLLVYLFKINDNMAYNMVFPVIVIVQYYVHRKYTFKI